MRLNNKSTLIAEFRPEGFNMATETESVEINCQIAGMDSREVFMIFGTTDVVGYRVMTLKNKLTRMKHKPTQIEFYDEFGTKHNVNIANMYTRGNRLVIVASEGVG